MLPTVETPQSSDFSVDITGTQHEQFAQSFIGMQLSVSSSKEPVEQLQSLMF